MLQTRPIRRASVARRLGPLRSPALAQVLGPSPEALARFDFKIAKRAFDDLNRSLESFLKPLELVETDG